MIIVKCEACALSPPSEKKSCRECNGVGHFERYEECKQQYPECPIEYDPMVNGWECKKCGQSGPV